MARRHRDEGPFDDELVPPYTTVHTGTIHGGTALNIVPRDCYFEFEFRHLPQDDPHALLEEFRRHVSENIEPEMHAAEPGTGFSYEPMSHIPGLSTDEVISLINKEADGVIFLLWGLPAQKKTKIVDTKRFF